MWSFDGSEIAFSTWDVAALSEYVIRRKASNMSSGEQTVVRADQILHPWHWSRNGELLYTKGWADGDLWVVRLEDDAEPIELVAGPGAQNQRPVFSGRARWFAYVSNEFWPRPRVRTAVSFYRSVMASVYRGRLDAALAPG